jgi:hypothetical protein
MGVIQGVASEKNILAGWEVWGLEFEVWSKCCGLQPVQNSGAIPISSNSRFV